MLQVSTNPQRKKLEMLFLVEKSQANRNPGLHINISHGKQIRFNTSNFLLVFILEFHRRSKLCELPSCHHQLILQPIYLLRKTNPIDQVSRHLWSRFTIYQYLNMRIGRRLETTYLAPLFHTPIIYAVKQILFDNFSLIFPVLLKVKDLIPSKYSGAAAIPLNTTAIEYGPRNSAIYLNQNVTSIPQMEWCY